MATDKKTYDVITPVHHDRVYVAGEKITGLNEDDSKVLLEKGIIRESDVMSGSTTAGAVNLDAMKKADLVDYAKARNLAVDTSLNKEELVIAIKAAEAPAATGAQN